MEYSKQRNQQGSAEQLSEEVVAINRVTKVVKGGKRMRFTALVVVGNRNGRVGCARGRASGVREAIEQAKARAQKQMILVPVVNSTIPHQVVGKFGAGKVVLKPARPGTGIIASRAVRAVVESAGIGDILTKSLRSRNPYNLIYATLEGLKQLSTREEVERLRSRGNEG
jgi:small subunit ribosomal protein S5